MEKLKMKKLFNKSKLAILGTGLLATMAFSGCTKARLAKFGSLGDEFKIELLNCAGDVTREWISTGKPQSEANSDGYYFEDKETGKIVEVSGTLIFTPK